MSPVSHSLYYWSKVFYSNLSERPSIKCSFCISDEKLLCFSLNYIDSNDPIIDIWGRVCTVIIAPTGDAVWRLPSEANMLS